MSAESVSPVDGDGSEASCDASQSEGTYSKQLQKALNEADIRVLLMVMFHFTGDHRWLDDPYRPVRDVRLIADPGSGISEEIQSEIKEAAFDLLGSGIPIPVVDTPTDEQMLEMMRFCLGETVAAEYVPMMLNELGFAPDPVHELKKCAGVPLTVSIIGSGVSGIAAAIKFKQAGVPFEIFEKNPAVGGTWFENTYPDCGVDTPNHFYSYSFAPNHEWSHFFSLRDEIFRYIEDCVDSFDIRSSIHFDQTVVLAEWSHEYMNWTITCESSEGVRTTSHSSVLISAVGQMNRPKFPDIDGLDRFKGRMFHSANWPSDVDLAGKSVGVIGVGASAMQFVPTISRVVESLSIFQRSPQWARPIGEYRVPVSEGMKWLLQNVPYYAAWLRFTLEWRYGDGLHRHLFKDESWPHSERSINEVNDRHRAELTDYIRNELNQDEDLIAKSLPTYPPYAKRMLIDNGWYHTLTQPNVDLITDPIVSATECGLVTTDGQHHEMDVLILATGFRATNLLGHIEIVGRDGVRLSDRWGDDNPRAYLGMTVPEFPNLFVLYGPNTNLAHGGSIIFHAECQVRYLMDLLEQVVKDGRDSVEVRWDVHDHYNAEVDAAHEKMVWTHTGVAPWYRNRAGRVVSNSPWRLVDYWHMTEHADLTEYLVDDLPERLWDRAIQDRRHE